MALTWADKAIEQSTTTTTGAYQLEGVPANAPAGSQTFVAGVGDGNTCYYEAEELAGTAFERGIGTVTDATPDTLTRTAIHASSNGGSAVDWTGKTVRITATLSADAIKTLNIPAQADVTGSRALNTTYTNSGARSILVAATVRCAVTTGGGTAYVQGKSDTATPPTTAASGIVGIQAGLLNEDNTFQCVFVVAPGKTYILASTAATGTVTLGSWFETTL